MNSFPPTSRPGRSGQALAVVAALLAFSAAGAAAFWLFAGRTHVASISSPAVVVSAPVPPAAVPEAPTAAELVTTPAENAAGSLVFESTAVRVPCAPSEDSAELIFKFKNKGDKPVRVLELDISCGCLQAEVDKAEYKPGESGHVKAIMKVGVVEGEMSKPIKVMTNDPANPVIALEAIVDVPQLFQFEPAVTTWQLNEDPKPKVVKAKILWKDPIHLIKASSTRENVTPTIREITAGREYEIILTPKSTASPELGLISIETDSSFSKYTRRQIYFNIVRPKP